MSLVLPSQTQVKQFRAFISRYYAQHKRSLAFRDNPDPYSVVVSEIMLQQTQVSRVITKFAEFISVFPDFTSLAQARFADLYPVWKGLGYNRRARYLNLIAKRVVNEFAGVVPTQPDILKTFPGIGPATAGSIYVFITNKPYVFIETNIRRVMLYHFFPQEDKVADAQIEQIVKYTLPHKNVRDWYYALMDYGTYLKSVLPNPNIRSKHYTKQSQFTGSKRQARSHILAYLLTHTSATQADLQTYITPKRHVNQALHELSKEHLIRSSGKGYFLV